MLPVPNVSLMVLAIKTSEMLTADNKSPQHLIRTKPQYCGTTWPCEDPEIQLIKACFLWFPFLVRYDILLEKFAPFINKWQNMHTCEYGLSDVKLGAHEFIDAVSIKM